MRYLSLLSGIEAASVAWVPWDWGRKRGAAYGLLEGDEG